MTETNQEVQNSNQGPPARSRVHLHIFLAHFPVSLFAVSAGFQILHLFTMPTCLEIAGNICLGGAALAIVPTAFSGWWTWKHQYRAYRSTIFLRKITIAYFMLGFSILTLIMQSVLIPDLEQHRWDIYHWVYFAATMVLFGGAVVEGYLGGTLHHR